MKLKFQKNKDEEISIQIEDNNFTTKEYVQMIKDIKNGKKIEAEFSEDITQEEQDGVNSMLEEINNIGKTDTNQVEETNEVIDQEEVPF